MTLPAHYLPHCPSTVHQHFPLMRPQSRLNSKPRPLGYSLSRLSSATAVCAALLAGVSGARAANRYWDPASDLSNSGGLGTWDQINLFWNTQPNNTGADVAWVNGADIAIFGGSGASVNLGEAIIAGGLTFNAGGYDIGGASTLTLTGATPTVTVTNLADTATISGVLAGTAGLLKSGNGTLVLSADNSIGLSGTITINQGTLSISGDTNLGLAANSLTINGGTLQANGFFASGRAITLGASGGTIDVTPASNFSLTTAIVANGNTLTKTNNGTLTLVAASARTGTTLVSGGTLAVNNVGALGSGDVAVSSGAILQNAHNAVTQNWATNVILNGGRFTHNPGANQQLNIAAGKAITIGALGGTIEVSPGGGSTSKILLAAAQLTGAGQLTKEGPGVLQLSAANAGFTGAVSLNAGSVEFQNADALGTGTTTITVASGGDFALNSTAVTARHNFVLSGGTLSANGTVNTVSYTGSINVASDSNIGLRYFQALGTADGFTISGPLTGAGNLNVTAPAAATLTLTSNRAGHTGAIIAGTNATVSLNSLAAINGNGFTVNGGTIAVRAASLAGASIGTPGLNATYYNFGTNPGIGASNFAVDNLYLAPRAFSRTDANINLINSGSGDWATVPQAGYAVGVGAGGQQDGVMWKGLINITNPATYQFSGTSDDNYVLIIDGVQVGTLGVIATNTNLT